MTEEEQNAIYDIFKDTKRKCSDCGVEYGYSMETMGHCCKCWAGTYDGNSQCGC